MSDPVCVIVGASHAAAQFAASLRQGGWEGAIRMIGDEPTLPYHRPPLSKALLSGDVSAGDLLIRPAAFYDKHGIEVVTARVCAIDRARKIITLAEGGEQRYDKLALCTGARPIRLPVPGADLPGVHYLRTVADAEALRSRLPDGSRAVVIGGGYIGLEAAATLREHGLEVVVLEQAERLLARVTAPEVASFFYRVHTEAGVRIECRAEVTAIEGDEHAERVVCADGSAHPADLVVVGIGIRPEVELAAAAGLEVDDGIVVDEHCRTADPDVVAAGDCASQWQPESARRRRLESVPNANEQGKAAAAALLGKPPVPQGTPWFWSDQYDLKLQTTGLMAGYDQVVIRGDIEAGRSFAAFYFTDGRLIAADCVNRAQEFIMAKKLLGQGSSPETSLFADESLTPKELLTHA